MWYGIKQILWVILLPFVQITQAQHPKTASCAQVDFDKKVNSLLSYTVPVISVDNAFDKKDKVIFLDTREWDEYRVSHLPNALYAGYDHFDTGRLKNIDKDAEIIVYCSIGYRSEKIGQKLKKAGFSNVKNLYGSIFEWVNRGYPVYDSNEKITTHIHTYNKKWSQWVNHDRIKKVW